MVQWLSMRIRNAGITSSYPTRVTTKTYAIGEESNGKPPHKAQLPRKNSEPRLCLHAIPEIEYATQFQFKQGTNSLLGEQLGNIQERAWQWDGDPKLHDSRPLL